MDKNKLNEVLSNPKLLEEKISFYLGKGVLKKQESSINEIKGHIAKAEHNVKFFQDQNPNFSDWIIVGCYYAVYHMALALILTKGFFSKNHDATLCILIKYFRQDFSDEEIKNLNNIQLSNEDILFYIKSKNDREKANYSTQIDFEKQNVEFSKVKTLEFMNKCKEILKT